MTTFNIKKELKALRIDGGFEIPKDYIEDIVKWIEDNKHNF